MQKNFDMLKFELFRRDSRACQRGETEWLFNDLTLLDAC